MKTNIDEMLERVYTPVLRNRSKRWKTSFSGCRWTKEEEDLLIKQWNETGNVFISKFKPRSRQSVITKRNRMIEKGILK